MNKIGLFYGPEGGNVERVALLVAEKIGLDKVDIHKVKDVSAKEILAYSNIVIGLSTLGKHNWSSDNTGNDWDKFLPMLKEQDLSDKKMALFGLGDHISYAENFVDSIGDFVEIIEPTNVQLVGQCSTDGYEYNESRAVKDGEFLGLPIDEDFENDLTEERVDAWLKLLLPQFI